MDIDCNDTIMAIATAPGGAARGVVRMSGPDAIQIASRCFASDGGPFPPMGNRNLARPGSIRLDELGRELAGDLYIWPTARSYTRQTTVEFHTIGSPPLLECVLRAVRRAGARLAQPGEFTLRAFLAGRLDLTQAEAVLGVIDSRGPRQLERALGQLAGGLSRPLQSIRAQLIGVLAELEAGLDFVEEDIQFITPRQTANQLEAAILSLDEMLEQLTDRGLAGAAPRVVLMGEPNVGKSSLFNALIQNSGALVSDLAGTTRDYLSARLRLDGVECELVDTAGVDDQVAPESSGDHDAQGANEAIHRAAGRLSTAQHAAADVRILCVDATRPRSPWELEQLQRKSGDQGRRDDAQQSDDEDEADGARITILTKADLAPEREGPASAIRTSSKTGQGLDLLRRALAEVLNDAPDQAGIGLALTASRCRDSLQLARESIERALALSDRGDELIAAELRGALWELGKVVGEVYTEDILDRIFSQFCIGK